MPLDIIRLDGEGINLAKIVRWNSWEEPETINNGITEPTPTGETRVVVRVQFVTHEWEQYVGQKARTSAPNFNASPLIHYQSQARALTFNTLVKNIAPPVETARRDVSGTEGN